MKFSELNELYEKLIRKKVIRQGKKKLLKKSDRVGFTVDKSTGREVKMSARERLIRSKSQRRGAIKRKAKKTVSSMKRQRSIKKRTFDK